MPAGAPPTTARLGLIAGLGAYLTWGLFPLYWKSMAGVPATQILAHRCWWSLAFVSALVAWRGGWGALATACRAPRTALTYLLSATLIAVNWLVFIWAVNDGRAIEVSIGYFMTPLVNVALGVVLLRERLRRVQIVAILLAVVAVAALTIAHGALPWIALALSLSFGGYGLVRKLGGLDPLQGLWLETAYLAPPALAWILLCESRGDGALHRSGAGVITLLVLGGVVTAVPLMWFARAVRSLPLSTIGLMQFITPSCQLVVALAVFHEPLTRAQAMAFPIIWGALALYVVDAVRQSRSSRPAEGVSPALRGS